MKWITYNLLFAVGYTLLLPRFFLRMWRRGGYRRGFLERFGLYTPGQRAALAARRRVWIHAVSVGEMFVGLRFLRELRARNPGLGFVVTTTTSTGHALARARLDPSDVLLYVPVDFPWSVRRAVRHIRPLALLLVEGEVWPNLVRRLHRDGVPVLLVNGRMSAHSYGGFARIRPFVRDIYARLTLFAVQGRADADRFRDLGAPPPRVAALGSAKYDIARADAETARPPTAVLERAGFDQASHLLVGGSTWPGEERALLDLFRPLRQEFPQARLVLVPRHAERAAEVEEDIRASGLSWVRRSALDQAGPKAGADVLLVDTTGELKGFYAAATVVFVGKSLTRHGGQNIMEPAALGKPVLVGPNMENFLPVMEDFLQAKAVIQVADAGELGRRLGELLRDQAARDCFGDRARRLVRDKSGVVAATVDRILRDVPALAP